jgi:hypothetical protein
MTHTFQAPPTLIDFIENYYGCSSDEMLKLLSRDDLDVVGDGGDFLDLLNEQRPDGSGPALRSGELRPVVGHGIADIAAGGIQLEYSQGSTDGTDASSAIALDVRSLLLYAHTVSIADPFGSSMSLEGAVGSASFTVNSLSGTQRVRFGLDVICRLAPLISSGVVFVAPPVAPPGSDDIQRAEAILQDLVPQLALGLVRLRALTFSDQSDLYLRCRTLAERFLRQEDLLGVLTPERATRLVACAAESAALPFLASLRARQDSDHQGDPWTLSELMRLRLQGAGRIRLADMIAIRDDDAFTVFRHDMSDAIAWSASRSAESDPLEQTSIIADEMRSAAERLRLETRRSVVLSATLGDAVSWIVGASVGGALDGWRGAALGLAAKGAADLAHSGPSQSRRALRNHYVELSRPVAKTARESARERLRRQRSGRVEP